MGKGKSEWESGQYGMNEDGLANNSVLNNKIERTGPFKQVLGSEKSEGGFERRGGRFSTAKKNGRYFEKMRKANPPREETVYVKNKKSVEYSGKKKPK